MRMHSPVPPSAPRCPEDPVTARDGAPPTRGCPGMPGPGGLLAGATVLRTSTYPYIQRSAAAESAGLPPAGSETEGAVDSETAWPPSQASLWPPAMLGASTCVLPLCVTVRVSARPATTHFIVLSLTFPVLALIPPGPGCSLFNVRSLNSATHLSRQFTLSPPHCRASEPPDQRPADATSDSSIYSDRASPATDCSDDRYPYYLQTTATIDTGTVWMQ